jgi:glycerophosphoryl diester phosphodiesterase
MKVFAHRGFSGAYPENTMLAFTQAVAAGADGIELDVHLSNDGKPVIIHDETLLRTTGKPGSVHDYTLDELTSINAGKTFDDKHGDTPIPAFETYCAYIRDKDILTNVEIKTDQVYYPGIEEIVREMVARYDLDDKIIFSSFNWLSVLAVKQLAPHISAGLLREDKALVHAAHIAKRFGIEYYHPGFDLLDDATVKECEGLGIGLNVWTVNTKERLDRLIKWNVAGVISNYPDMCLAVLRC